MQSMAYYYQKISVSAVSSLCPLCPKKNFIS